jgi:serine/threonine protein phosphatase 1
MSQRVIAIGDVHGCATALATLLEAVRPQPEDTLVVLGDAVDRGPDSRGVIEELLRLRETCRLVPLMGNHEEMMLNYLDGRPQPDDWLECGGASTVESYGRRDGRPDVPEEHVAFMRTWQDYFETDTHLFMHASYESLRPMAEQRWHLLRWHSLRDGVPGPHASGKPVIVGHTSQKTGEVLDLGYLVCIDTYCWGGGWLTAMDAASGTLWQANDRGQLRS